MSAATDLRDRALTLLPARDDLAAMLRQPRRDLVAGLTVAIVALPLALGFGISSGLGAAAGLTTAVVAGALAAVFGGSGLQVSGPTGAMTVVLVPIMHTHGTGGVLTVGLLAGLILIGLAIAKAGRYMAYVPASVVEGFTLGIACVIGLQQIPAALGVAAPHGDQVAVVAARAVTAFAAHPHWTAAAVAGGVAALVLAGGRLRPSIPFSIVAVVAALLWIRGAGLDVTTPEPLPPDDPLWGCPNLAITPHNSGMAPVRQVRLVALVAENVRRYASGAALLNVVDKARGY